MTGKWGTVRPGVGTGRRRNLAGVGGRKRSYGDYPTVDEILTHEGAEYDDDTVFSAFDFQDGHGSAWNLRNADEMAGLDEHFDGAWTSVISYWRGENRTPGTVNVDVETYKDVWINHNLFHRALAFPAGLNWSGVRGFTGRAFYCVDRQLANLNFQLLEVRLVFGFRKRAAAWWIEVTIVVVARFHESTDVLHATRSKTHGRVESPCDVRKRDFVRCSP